MFKQPRLLLAATAALSLLATVAPLAAASGNPVDDAFTFNMVVSGGAKTCLPNAAAKVRIDSATSAWWRGWHCAEEAGISI